jgi:hypothetical protein
MRSERYCIRFKLLPARHACLEGGLQTTQDQTLA